MGKTHLFVAFLSALAVACGKEPPEITDLQILNDNGYAVIEGRIDNLDSADLSVKVTATFYGDGYEFELIQVAGSLQSYLDSTGNLRPVDEPQESERPSDVFLINTDTPRLDPTDNMQVEVCATIHAADSNISSDKKIGCVPTDDSV